MYGDIKWGLEGNGMTRIYVCGSRTFNDVKLLEEHIRNAYWLFGGASNVELVVGDAPGADTLAANFAESIGLMYRVIPLIDKDPTMRDAIIRNYCNEASAYGAMCLAFWDGHSEGTKRAIDLANSARFSVEVVNF